MTPKRYIIPVFVPHLGCPNQCVFCNQKKISGAPCPVTAAEVKAEIAKLNAPVGSQRELAFYGGSFTAIDRAERVALLEAASDFVAEGGVIRISTRPDAIDENILYELKSHGVQTIELGCQSMCNEVLEKSGRGHTAQDVDNAAALIKKHGFRLILQMMTGLPGDTLDRATETAKRLIALSPDCVRIYPTVIIRDTELYRRFLAGDYREHTVDEAVNWCAKIVPLFQAAQIPIIRMGLNPSDELSCGDAVGGAYHPALGELVYGEIYRQKLDAMLEQSERNGVVTVCVARGKASAAAGVKRKNTRYLEEKYGVKIKIREDENLSGDEIKSE